MNVSSIVAALAKRDSPRTEATVQADIRQLLLTAPLDLNEGDLEDIILESPVGDRRRIDVEVGACVIEVKKDLRKGNVRSDAIQQLAGYLETRESTTGCRYVGILTDGAEWRCYHLADGVPLEVSAAKVKSKKPDVDSFLMWLEGVLATSRDVAPTPEEVGRRLGAGSSAHALDRASLFALYKANRELPSVRMKRQLWARLLTTALGTQFEDRDELFVEHSLLVASAEIIAHAVLGLELEAISPASLLSGAKFDESGIHGVVEADFFDWVIEVPGGEVFVRTLARRLERFNWDAVDHDVLKVLYESVIGRDTRKKLGEYYTPDWLASKIVDVAVLDELTERVLDPACGSGTFLFHVVRHYLKAADARGLDLSETLARLTRHVIGMDLHPVAVTLARVTYILAIGREKLSDPRRGAIRVPVYLGDSLQWQEQRPDLWSAGQLVILADDQLELFASELRFPNELLANARVFDELVQELAAKASSRIPGAQVPSLSGVLQRLAIPASLHETILATFATMCRLHDENRNHIWGYYVRNLARPMWLAREENRVDLLIGNPPWLAFRHMTAEMQVKFREMSDARSLWHGATVATHQDLSGLFVARAVELYLRMEGRFAMVMPNAVVDRAQFAGFRSGVYTNPATTAPVYASFETPWDLRRIRPHFFPRGSAVIFGSRSKKQSALPLAVQSWSGRLPATNAPWSQVAPFLSTEASKVRPSSSASQSPYRKRFTQGAILAPRILFVVDERQAGPLGVPAGRTSVRSCRGANEKRPWKTLDDHEGVVESEFVRPLFMGENVLPYRTLAPSRAVIPWDPQGLLDGTSERIELYPGLADWWRRAESCWNTNRSTDRLSLAEQLDYRGKLSAQFPIQPERIVYSKSGMHLAAARVFDHRAVINNSLYWATVGDEGEGSFLCAILNARYVTELVRPLMSYGKDERHFDKYIWQLPVPSYDPSVQTHVELAKLGAQAEAEVATLQLETGKHFPALRRQIRKHLETSDVGNAIEEVVEELLG